MKDLTYLEKYRQAAEELRLYGRRGNAGNGIFKVFVEGRSFSAIASNGGGWEHVSVSPWGNKKRCPTWEEMCAIKDLFFEEGETVMQLHPPKSECVNLHPYCLHLWRPKRGEIPLPPRAYV